MKLGKLIAVSFQAARAKYPELSKQWIKISLRVGGRLPNSMLLASIQRDGEVDLLVRAIEDEFSDPTHIEDDSFQSHYLILISTYWLCSVYETFRLLREKKLADDTILFRDTLRNLELVRITLAKHEIAKDRSIKDPLTLHRVPAEVKESAPYLYDPKDSSRSHIMPTGMSSRGSVTWQATDVLEGRSFWVERRSISDGIIELWGQDE